MWTAILALLQSVPVVARIVEKLTPTRREQQIDKIRNDKQHEREQIDTWVDRGGSPQIYRMPSAGGAAQRVTFSGSYNISPALSPDGRWLAYVTRVAGQFKLQVMELASGQASAITETTADERPSFAPNSKLIVYATALQGREALMTSTLDGKIKARLAGKGGDIREPNWGPFR